MCEQGGKIDIVGAAAGYIVELERRRQCLRARNEELILQQAARTRTEERPGGGMVVKVRAQSERHSVAVDVFEIVLRRLKAMEALRVTGVRSCFRGGGGGGMWMNVGVECQVQPHHRPKLDSIPSLSQRVLLDSDGTRSNPCDLF